VRRGRQIACVCLLGLFSAALYTSLGYSLIDALGPGPGFFPFWLSLVGGALTVGILVQDLRSHAFDGISVLPTRQAATQAGGVLVALIAAAALLEPLGFRLTMLAFIAGLLVVLGARSPAAIIFTALGGSFGVFHVFSNWLKVPLPVGPLGL
jgi:putative tricarboxylic transport membrane protein